MGPILADVAAAARGAARHRPGTLALIAGIGVSAGAGAVVFAALHALLLAPPPGVAGASRLVTLHTSQYSGGTYGPSSLPDLLAIGAGVPALAAVAAETEFDVNVSSGATARAVRAAAVSPGYFDVLGLAAGETDAAAARISHALWRELGRPEAGRVVLTLDGREHAVSAVLPPGFHGLRFGRPVHVWVPMAEEDPSRGWRTLSAIGRLRPGARLEDAQAQLSALAAQLADAHPETNRGTARSAGEPRRFTAQPYRRLPPEERGRALVLAAVAVGATLLILASACVNTAGILLNRAAARRREIAGTLALGASRARLSRQLAVERALILLAGGAAGLLIAHVARFMVPAALPVEVATLLPASLDLRAIGGMLLACAAAGLLFGVIPAVFVSRTNPAEALGGAGAVTGPPGARTFRTAVVVAQIACTTVFLLSTAAAHDALGRALEADVGMLNRRLQVMTVQTGAGGGAYAEVAEDLQGAGLRAIAWTTALPLERGSQRRFAVRVESDERQLAEQAEADVVGVTRDFFGVARMQMMEGRLFEHAGGGPMVRVVVNDVFASRYLGGRATGQRLTGPGGEAIEVAGVLRGGRYRTLQEASRPVVYYPLAELPSSRLYLVAAPDRLPPGADLKIRNVIEARGMRVTRVALLEELFAERLVLDRALVRLVSAAGALSLVLALVGVYGLLSELVLRRTREIGVRLALGASASGVARLILGGTAWLAVAGLASGVFAAYVLSRLAATLVFGVPSATPRGIAITAVLIGIVVLAAAAGPLRRALRISPSVALRAQ